MSVFTVPLIVFGALLALILLSGLAWRKLVPRRFSGPIFNAILVVGAAALLGIGGSIVYALRVKAPDLTQGPTAIGVVPPRDSRPGRGTASGLHIRFNGCGERVKGWLAVNGTAEYWADRHEAVREQASLRVALPREDTEIVSVALSSSADDIAVPSGLPNMQIVHELLDWETYDSDDLKIVRIAIRDWAETFAPVVVRFTADWTEPRSFGSCYLRMPTLAGGDTVPPAYAAVYATSDPPEYEPGDSFVYFRDVRVPLKEGWQGSAGTTTLDVGRARILADQSLPAPEDNVAGLPAWLCAVGGSDNTRVGEKRDPDDPPDRLSPDNDRAVGAVARDLFNAEFDDCGSIAVIQEGGARRSPEFLLLVAGALLSLGATLLLERALRGNRARSGAPASVTAPTPAPDSRVPASPIVENLVALALLWRVFRRR